MHAIKVVMTTEDFDKFIKNHLDAGDVEKYADCTWIPAKISITDLLEIEVLAVPAK